MDRLPLGIIGRIASYLPKPSGDGASSNADSRLVRLAIASVSRKWQFAVEPLVFRSMELESTDLDEFASVFSASQP